MSKRLFILILTVTTIIIFCGNLLAQKPIPGLFRTGVNNDGIAQTPGSLELHYSMQNAQAPQVVARNNLWVQPPQGSAWISLAGGNQSLPIGTYVYKLTFDLSGFDPSTAKISGQITSDNSLTILINGIDTGFSNLPTQFQRLDPFYIDTGFVAGTNTLEFHVLNSAVGPSGLLVADISGEACENAEDCGLVAYYPFNGNANDMSGNSNHGTLRGATPPQLTTDRFGNPQQAYLFNGSTAYIEAPNSSSLQSPTQAITIAAWVNARDWHYNSAGGFIVIAHKSKDSIWRQYALNIRMNREWGFIETCYSQAPVANANPFLNKWTFVVLTFDENTDRLQSYLDGVLVHTKLCAANIPTPDASPLLIGLDVPGASEYLNGSMDDLRIYNRALSQNEILQLYHENGWPLDRDDVLLKNGGFEFAAVNPGNRWIELPTGSAAIEGWRVTGGNIDYIGTHWIASENSRSLDLNGTTAGSISQSFKTLKGSTYYLQFDMAGNTDCAPSLKKMRVTAAGASQEFDFDTAGKSRQNMGWQRKAFGFTAIDTLTTLTLTSLVSGACGPAIDNVRISKSDEDIAAPAIPQELRAVVVQNKATLTWKSNAETDLLRYRIYRSTNYPNFTLHNSVPAGTTTFVDAGLNPNVICFYRLTAIDSALNESDFSNEVSSFVPSLPNLHVTSVKASPTAFSAQSIRIDWTVSNSGNDGTQAPQWFDAVYLSNTVTFDPQKAIYLGRAENFSALDVGQGYNSFINYTLPRDLSGTHYVFVVADYTNREHETDENDNRGVPAAVQVQLSPFPDLQITSALAPANAFSGDSVQVSWTVKNFGTGRAGSSRWFETIFLSKNDTLDFNFISSDKIRVNETVLGVVTHSGALDAGQTYTASAKVKLPHTIFGDYFIFVATDLNGGQTQLEEGENYENKRELNFSTGKAIRITLMPPPDLTVGQVSATSATASLGEDVTVEWTVKNEGASAPFEKTWEDMIYLSRTAVFNLDSSLALGALRRNSTLKDDSSYIARRSVRIPNGFAGRYFVFVKTDWNNGVFEHTFENNNTSPAPVSILITAPNLAVSVVELPLMASSGKNFEVRWTVANRGPGAVFNSSWNDRVFLSRQATFNADSVVALGAFTYSGALRVDSSYTVRRAFALPNGVSGTRYVFVETNGDRRVFENQFVADNRGRSPNAMRIDLSPWPDLRVTALQAPPASVRAGDRLAITWTGSNNGAAATENIAWTDRVYLSPETVYDPAKAILLASADRDRSLAPSTVYNQSRTVTLPTNLAGTYCLTVQTDANNSVYEHTDENNNLLHSSVFSVTPYPPVDLAARELTKPDSALTGNTIAIRFTVENLGQAATLAAGWNDRIYFSLDQTLERNADLLIATLPRSGALRAAENYERQYSFKLPNNLTGAYFLIAETDVENAVNDAGRANNLTVSRTPLRIKLAPSPDLLITRLKLPAQTNAGQPARVVYTVENRGDGGLNGATWHDAVYLSNNAELDASDAVLAAPQRRLILAPKASYTDSIEVEMPGFAAGTYFLITKTDSRNDIYEHNAELNNVRLGETTSAADTSRVKPIKIIQPAPADLIVSQIIIPANAMPGEETTIKWTLKNIGANRATGRLREAAYISADTIWQVEDPLFGVLTHNIDIAPGGSQQISMKVNLAQLFRADAEGNITAELPGVTPGKYHAIVRTDIRRNIRETNTANNALASAALMDTDVQELKLGVPVTGMLAAEEKRYYKLESRETGATIQLDLQNSDSTAANELYVAFGRTPTLNDYDFASIEPQKATQQVLIPSSQIGKYFLLLSSRSQSSVKAAFSLKADSLAFAIHLVDSKVGGNTGQVTVQLLGAKFDNSMTVTLKKGNSTILAHDLLIVDQTKAFASFNLNGAVLGFYDLSVQTQSGKMVSLLNGFEVVPGTEELLVTKVQFPSAAREGQIVSVTIDFMNAGNIDIPRSSSIVASLSGASIGYSPDHLKYKFHSLYTDYREPKGPRDYLRPGVRGSITIYSKVQGELRFELFRTLVNLDINNPIQALLPGNTNSANECPINWIYDGICSCVPDLIFSSSCLIHDSCYDFCGSEKIICDLIFLNAMISSCRSVFGADGLEFDICKGVAIVYYSGVVIFGESFFEDAQAEACKGGGGSLPDYPPVDPLPPAPKDRPCAPGSKCFEIPVQRAIDPNDITGPAGFGDERWITATQTLPYTIRFENDSTKATAAAQVVTIRQKLDSTLDSRSFRLGNFGFSNRSFTVPENRAFYSTRLDVRDSLGVFVDVNAGLDVTTNEAFWIFRAIDPATGQLPVFNGFLPVNNAQHRGEGFANYTIRPRNTAKTGEVVRAKASIVFDTNEPIDTPEIFNTVDALIPSSRIAALPATINTTTFTLRWSGQDAAAGSKIRAYALYVSENNQPFELFESDLADASLVFSGDPGNTYRFFILAADNAGNIEPLKIAADATVMIDPNATSVADNVVELPKTFALYQNYPNPFNPTTTFRYDLPKSSHVKLVIYNMLGQKVRIVINAVQEAGIRSVQWDGKSDAGVQVASGVFFYRLEAGDFVKVRKMLLMR